MIVGMTINEYVHKRRLTAAALELKNSQIKIIDLAINCGYQSSESFSKAFKQFHGCLPSEAKDSLHPVKYFKPITIKLTKRSGNVIDTSLVKENQDNIIQYYQQSNECLRMTSYQSAKNEFSTTMHYFNQLFKKGSTIFDCRYLFF